MKRMVMEPPAKNRQAALRPDDDGTRALLTTGLWTLVAGAVAALLAETVLGGIGINGPHTNAGWLALMVAMMFLPFGLMLSGLGFAKWLRKRKLRRLG